MNLDYSNNDPLGITKTYKIESQTVTITWFPLSSFPHFGNRGRYIKLHFKNKPPQYLRNPHSTPLLHHTGNTKRV